MSFLSFCFSVLLVNALSNPDKTFPSEEGPTGLLESVSAIPNSPSDFSIGLTDSFFFSDNFINSEKHARNRLRLSANYSFRGGFEAFLGTGSSFNDHSNADQSRSSTSFFEDSKIGLRWSLPIIENKFYFGTYAYAGFLSGSRAPRQVSGFINQQSGPFAYGKLMLLSSLDMSKTWSRLPMRFHLNLGYRSPTGNRQPISEEPSELPISKIDIFNLNSFKYQSVLGSLSAEALFRWAVAFVELNTEYAIVTGSESLGYGDNRHSVSVGGIWLPHESFGIITAAEVGIGGDSTKHSAGIPHNIPWQAYLGVKFKTNADQLFRAIGSIRGRISDADTGFPLAETKITLIGEVGLPQTTNMVGGFQFESLSPKTYQLRIERQGYQPQTKSVEVESGESAFVEILLDGTGPKNGNLNILITDLQTGGPISKAYIKISSLDRPLTSDDKGEALAKDIPEGLHTIRIEAPGYVSEEFPLEIFPKETISQSYSLQRELPNEGTCAGKVLNQDGTGLTAVFTDFSGNISPFGTDPLSGNYKKVLKPGRYTFKVQAENYLPQEVICEVSQGENTQLDIMLEKPQKAVVVEDKIVLPEAIFFAFNSDQIEGRSFETLDQVTEVILKANSQDVISIEGHTDSVGSEEYNQNLSERRAKSVRQYLINQGVDANRLRASGFGETKPVATNVTGEGRSENRRVEFNIFRAQK
ncbi:MAG: carboxypeptidase regulatory-like domain-containing protein [Bdellovibrionota bacterium]